MAAIDTYRMENDAEERGSSRSMLLGLVGDVAELRRDVRRLTWIAIPISCVALVLSIVALIIALQIAYLMLARAGAPTAPVSLSAPLATSSQWLAAPPWGVL